MEARDYMQIAKMLYAMEQKRKKPPMHDLLNNECYQRTMTDEYPWCKPPRSGLQPVSEEQKEVWRKLHDR